MANFSEQLYLPSVQHNAYMYLKRLISTSQHIFLVIDGYCIPAFEFPIKIVIYYCSQYHTKHQEKNRVNITRLKVLI